jgi:restriction endonuclease S subunit
MIAPATGKAFAVLFQDLRRWSVNSFFTIRWNWPSDSIKPLAAALERKAVAIDKVKTDPGDIVLVALHFDGAMEPRDASAAGFKGRLFLAEPGDVVYSKIDVRHGAIGVVPDSLPRISVSSEFPVYRVRPDVALPQYVKLLFRTEVFRRQINSLISGTSGRKRVQPSDLEEIEVPLPHPDIQRTIIAFWHEAESVVEAAQNNLAEPVSALNKRLLELYAGEASQDVIHSRFFVLGFKDFAAWDVKSGRASAFRLTCPSFRPMGNFIEEATEIVRPFDEPEKNWPVYGVNNKEGVFLNGYQKGKAFNAAYKRIRKDWFFHNPTRCNVGSLGIVPDVPEDAITSPEYQVWRVKEDIADAMLPGFVAVLIQTPFFIDLVQFNRVGAVKQRMYTENLCQLRIPYLPESEQREYAQTREKALTDLDAAKARLSQVRADVEAMIMGSRSVPRS